MEHYQVVLIDAARTARASMDGKLQQLCAMQVPGDTHRNLQVRPDYTGQTFKHILVPVWLLTYDYGAKSFQVAANGYTGKIAGEYPKRVLKIVLLAMLATLVIGFLLFVSR